LPEPVGATTRVCWPDRIAVQACSCAAVGASNAPVNQALVAGEKPGSESVTEPSLPAASDISGRPCHYGGRPCHDGGMSRWARVVVVCVLALTCSGCLRYHVQLRVDGGGTVSGQLVVAFRTGLPVNPGQGVEVPPPLRDKVAVAGYDRDGYVGSTFTFDRLAVDEVGVLFAGSERGGATVRLAMTRSGEGVSVTGTVFFPDLSLVGDDEGFDARIALTFAGASSVTANGTVSGQDVTWSPRPGVPITLSAHASFPRPTRAAAPSGPARSRTPATLFLGLSAVLAGVVVLLLARLRRRPATARQPPGHPPAWPAVPPGPYAGPYPTVPAGPGLSPRSTLPLPTVPLPGGSGDPHRRDQAGW
jgi:hypothetical protein